MALSIYKEALFFPHRERSFLTLYYLISPFFLVLRCIPHIVEQAEVAREPGVSSILVHRNELLLYPRSRTHRAALSSTTETHIGRG